MMVGLPDEMNESGADYAMAASVWDDGRTNVALSAFSRQPNVRCRINSHDGTLWAIWPADASIRCDLKTMA
jgi:hypothetical protein